MRSSVLSFTLARVGCCCTLAACIGSLDARDGRAVDVKNILVLFPEESGPAPAYRTIYTAIKSVFVEIPAVEATLFGESLDPYLFPEQARQQHSADFSSRPPERMNGGRAAVKETAAGRLLDQRPISVPMSLTID